MSNLSDIYNTVLAKEASYQEQNEGSAFDMGVAAASGQSDNELDEFVKIARAEGLTDDEIMQLIDEDDDTEKIAAFDQGMADELEKIAEEYGVNPEEVIDFMQGVQAGSEYQQGREIVQDSFEKMAAAKKNAAKSAYTRFKTLLSGENLKKMKAKVEKAETAAERAMSEAGGPVKGARGKKLQAAIDKARKGVDPSEARKVWATRAGVGAAGAGTVAGLGYGGYRLATRNRDD